MRNTLLALLGFILLSTPLAATAQQFGDFTYSETYIQTPRGGYYVITITGYTGPGGPVTIPASINGLPVTAIGNGAFFGTSLTSVTIPNTVTSIGDGAFRQCELLIGVTMFNGVTSIGSFAFAFCTSLTGVTIPSSVTSIGYSALAACTSLTAISVDAANAVYSGLDGVLFNKSQTWLIKCPAGKAGSYAAPGSVTNIGEDAFNYCTSLTSATIPAGVTSIGDYAFSVCTSLSGVFFKGNAPVAVGSNVFLAGATNATVYYLPGTTGWGATFAGRPAVLWNPLMQRSAVGPGGFGFNITGTTDIPIVIEAAASPANATWVPLQSLNLTNGAFYFSDPNWTNYPARFYRIRSP